LHCYRLSLPSRVLSTARSLASSDTFVFSAARLFDYDGEVAPSEWAGNTPAKSINDHETTRAWSTIMPPVLKSTAFEPGAVIPRRHTGDGEDLSPPLAWSGLPPDTRELALIVDDPDAPSPEPWVHWVIARIPAADTGIAEGVHPKPAPSFPAGAIQGKNSWGTVGYRGPAPPKGHGVHHYHFRLYALDAPLSVASGIDKPGLLKAMQGHVLAEAELLGIYQRG